MNKSTSTYIFAARRPWNHELFRTTVSKCSGKWILVTNPEKLTLAFVKKHKPRYIFFPDWSWLVPKEILDVAECVNFHATPLPFARGGSPLQNLIMHGYTKTQVCALRMEETLDAGPIYLRRPASLAGSGQEILARYSQIIARMIQHIVHEHPTPKPQRGTVVVFKRRKPEESNIALLQDPTMPRLYDFIRMLDIDEYPHAFVESNGYRFEFRNAKLQKKKGVVTATVVITRG